MRRNFLATGHAHAERMKPDDIVRFLAFVKLDGDCWIWTGALDEKGYGRFKIDGKVRWVHRLAYVTFKTALRAGNDVHHIRRCTSASCVNPDHLLQKSRAWNSIDGARRRAAGVVHAPAPPIEPAPF